MFWGERLVSRGLLPALRRWLAGGEARPEPQREPDAVSRRLAFVRDWSGVPDGWVVKIDDRPAGRIVRETDGRRWWVYRVDVSGVPGGVFLDSRDARGHVRRAVLGAPGALPPGVRGRS